MHGRADAQAHNSRPPLLRGPGWGAALGLRHAGMVAVPGEEKGGFLDGEGWSGGRWEEAVVVRLGLCICKRVLDMG